MRCHRAAGPIRSRSSTRRRFTPRCGRRSPNGGRVSCSSNSLRWRSMRRTARRRARSWSSTTSPTISTPRCSRQAKTIGRFAVSINYGPVSRPPRGVRWIAWSRCRRKTVRSSPVRSRFPNGVDLERFQPSSQPPEPRRLLFIGSFAHRPNVLALEFFLRDVFPRLENVTLHVIAGQRHQRFWDLQHAGRRSRRIRLRCATGVSAGDVGDRAAGGIRGHQREDPGSHGDGQGDRVDRSRDSRAGAGAGSRRRGDRLGGSHGGGDHALAGDSRGACRDRSARAANGRAGVRLGRHRARTKEAVREIC